MRFTLPGNPVPKGRPRVGRHGTYTPARTEQAENEWRWLFNTQQVQPFTVPVAVWLTFYMKDARRVDLDNLCKVPCDAGNPTHKLQTDGFLWADDSLIAELHAFRCIDRNNPRTILEVKPLD